MEEQKNMTVPRLQSSQYMHWVKSLGTVQYNLAVSGMPDFPLSELPYTPEDLVLSGTGSYGYAPLLQAIATRYNVPQECVVTTLGASMANYLALASTLQHGDDALIESPAYELLISTAQFLGANVRRFKRTYEEAFQLNIPAIERALTPNTKLIVLTNLHNPTSVYTDTAVLQQLGELAKNIGAKVLVGEIYLPTVFDRKPFSAVTLGNEFITTNSLTKAFGLSGLRLGWILAEPELARSIWRMIDLFYVNQATLSERLALRAFEHLPALTQRAQTLLDLNRTRFKQFLSEHPQIECICPEYGTVVFPRLKSGNTEEFIAKLRTEQSTLVAPGAFFDMPEHFRLGLCAKPEVFEEGLRRLGDGVSRL